MKISFEKKVFRICYKSFVVIAAGWIFISRLNNQRDKTMDSLLDWIEISLFVLSIILLIVVYFIIKSQLRAKKILKNHCTIADSYFSLLLTIHPILFLLKELTENIFETNSLWLIWTFEWRNMEKQTMILPEMLLIPTEIQILRS
jgi:uncharacterized membrane protein YhdT